MWFSNSFENVRAFPSEGIWAASFGHVWHGYAFAEGGCVKSSHCRGRNESPSCCYVPFQCGFVGSFLMQTASCMFHN